LSKAGFNFVLNLVEAGADVKASGFSRTDLELSSALKTIHQIHPSALMFGSDLPGTRAPTSFLPNDYRLILETLGEHVANRVVYQNAVDFYRPSTIEPRLVLENDPVRLF
jgi:hypothetical protein